MNGCGFAFKIDFIHLYLGCEVLVPKEQYWVDVAAKRKFPNDGIEKLQSVSFAGDGTITVSWPEGGFMILYPDDCKLILRLLSDMTEEEKKEYHYIRSDGYDYWFENTNVIQASTEINSLRKHGFDCDGLIEAGLGIDKTTLKVYLPVKAKLI